MVMPSLWTGLVFFGLGLAGWALNMKPRLARDQGEDSTLSSNTFILKCIEPRSLQIYIAQQDEAAVSKLIEIDEILVNSLDEQEYQYTHIIGRSLPDENPLNIEFSSVIKSQEPITGRTLEGQDELKAWVSVYTAFNSRKYLEDMRESTRIKKPKSPVAPQEYKNLIEEAKLRLEIDGKRSSKKIDVAVNRINLYKYGRQAKIFSLRCFDLNKHERLVIRYESIRAATDLTSNTPISPATDLQEWLQVRAKSSRAVRV